MSESTFQANLSHDGYVYTERDGLVPGVHTYGVIQPGSNVRDGQDNETWEAIVIGAGYTGLIAARDLVKAGKKTLLLEARDRIGGRSWSAQIDGTTYEMGGTWVSHAHGRLFAEMQRYGIKDDVSMTRSEGAGGSTFTLDDGSGPRQLSLKEAGDMTCRAWKILVNIDGNDARDILPLPYSTLGNSRVAFSQVQNVDKLSCADRLEQVKDQLSKDEITIFKALVANMAGGNIENVGFLELLRSQALQGFSPETFEEIWTLYKIRQGQSSLARRIFDNAEHMGLQYTFKSPIKSIVERDGVISLHTAAGKAYRGKRVINTIPLCVLPTIQFDPPLSALRQEALQIGHSNHLTKIHAEVEGDLRGLRGFIWPGDLIAVYGDGYCAGEKSTRVTAFAGDNRGKLDPVKEPERLVTAMKRFHPMNINKIVFHDWESDPYAMGGPAWYQAGYLTKFLAELQSRHGNMLMANSDWASGWRAFIEGAMEQGSLAADTVMSELGIRGANGL